MFCWNGKQPLGRGLHWSVCLKEPLCYGLRWKTKRRNTDRSQIFKFVHCLHCKLDSSFTHSFSVYTSSAVQSFGHTSVTTGRQQNLLKRCFLSVTLFFPARWRCNDRGHGQIFGPPGPAGAGGRLAPSGGLHGLQRWCAVTEVRHTPVNIKTETKRLSVTSGE